MTTYAKALQSERWDIGGKDDPSTFTRVYLVSDSAGPITTDPSVVIAAMQVANELDYPGEAITTFATTSLYATLRCRSIEATTIPGSAGKLSVQVTYSTLYAWEYEGTTPISAAVLRWHKTTQTRIRPMQIHRKLTDCDAAGSTGTSDINGTKVDYGGRPITVMVPQTDITLWRYLDSTQESLVVVDDIILTYSGKISSASVAGYAADTVLLQGIDLVHERDEYYVLRATLTYDKHKHYEQRPDYYADLDKKTNSSGQCSTVRWMRDYPTADLNNIFTSTPSLAYNKHRATKGEYLFTT